MRLTRILGLPAGGTRLAAALAVALTAGACAPSVPNPPPGVNWTTGDHVRLRLIAESQEAAPGSTLRLAVLFELDEGWHLYAPYRNDTGLPVLLEPAGTDGIRFGTARWPAPHRLVSEGSILDHVYEDRVAAVFPAEVPADAPPGTAIRIDCRVEWLVCGTGCIPGEGSVSLEVVAIPPGRTARPSPDRVWIEAAEARTPRPVSGAAADLAVRWGAADWSIEVPFARELAFFPREECEPLLDPIADGAAAAPRLRVRLASDAAPGARILGTLQVGTANGTEFYEIESSKP